MADIEQFVRELNKAWQEGRYEELREFYHEDVVLLAPARDELIEGVEKVIQSYRDFGAQATLRLFDITDIRVYDYGSISMCHMRFAIDYELDSVRMREEGLEVYAIDTSGDRPGIVWRTQISPPSNNA